jgi:hypothetical protein
VMLAGHLVYDTALALLVGARPDDAATESDRVATVPPSAS